MLIAWCNALACTQSDPVARLRGEALVAGRGFESLALGAELVSVLDRFGRGHPSISAADDISIEMSYASRALTLRFVGEGECARALRRTSPRRLMPALLAGRAGFVEQQSSCAEGLPLQSIDVWLRHGERFEGALRLADGGVARFGDRSGLWVSWWQDASGASGPPLGKRVLSHRGAAIGFERALSGPVDFASTPPDGAEQPKVTMLGVFR